MIFDTLLIANRGEIASRIMRSARELGLRTVAIFSEADRFAPHVRDADVAYCVGDGPARESYLRIDRVIGAALTSGAGAVHPGYGFLSESADFAEALIDAGLIFVGPTPEQLRLFGQKHTAREQAGAAGLTMLPGTGLLTDLEEAVERAAQIGYPVMLKSTAGGGGIGMQACHTVDELADVYASVERMARSSFGTGGLFLEALVERARHLEVQLFGDGEGAILSLGDRDCSMQRRNQKVIEEAPAPNLVDAVRAQLHAGATALGRSVSYRSAGTVEYVYDATREQAYFLEVNTRLQVEHGVTEEIFHVDLVAWMLRLANGDREMFHDAPLARGHAMEARLYAEDPERGFQPSAGLLTEVHLPERVRVDSWIEAGLEVSTFYDPMLAKLISVGADREAARVQLLDAVRATSVAGIETNAGLLEVALREPAFVAAQQVTATLGRLRDERPRVEVVVPGIQTAVVDWPGRLGYWHVGIPPSGAMDGRSFRLGNLALGNDEGAPGLEIVLAGPTLRFREATTVCLTGAPTTVRVDGQRQPMWQPFTVPAGGELVVGSIDGPGMRTYLLVAGGFAVPDFLGSASTFTLGGFGGHGGRVLRAGDVLRPREDAARGEPTGCVALTEPTFGDHWMIGVLEGPHAAPEFFTDSDIAMLYATEWEVHFNSARTGVRLVGPQPSWAREDGGEAGLHPSNIHDTAYAFATIDFTGDTPILLGPDGPSLGGFVCPATVATGERWKLGQLRPGDRITFVLISEGEAETLLTQELQTLALDLSAGAAPAPPIAPRDQGILARREEGDGRPSVTYRRQGDDNVLVEYGPMVLDLGLRMRVQSLAECVSAAGLLGVIDLTPGIRSLQVHLDPKRLRVSDAQRLLAEFEESLPANDDLRVASRSVHLPLSWDDPSVREATQRYMAGVRDDAPWCPWNIEFIRRINGLDSVEEVYRIVHEAEYLVLGLGDVYLGAPVATPLDPRHRLVTTKYNPARTWTPQNAVGIGGAYLCIYGMEGPGGYQLIGRTIPVWSSWHTRPPFVEDTPWLLRHFDRISWFPVAPEELLEQRAEMRAGRLEVEITEGMFSLGDYEQMLREAAPSIESFQRRQQAAFAEERKRWRDAGEFDRVRQLESQPTQADRAIHVLAEGEHEVRAPVAASVWKVEVCAGDLVTGGSTVAVLEAMKLEVNVVTPVDGTVVEILARPGDQVPAGHPLLVVREREGDV